jgi:hypothetical protein
MDNHPAVTAAEMIIGQLQFQHQQQMETANMLYQEQVKTNELLEKIARRLER